MPELSTDDLLRAKFWALLDEKEAILAKSQPLRDKRDALQPKLQAILDEQAALADQFKEIEGTRVYDIDVERAKIARALADATTGKSLMGERPAKD